LLLPQLAGLAALAVGERDDLGRAALLHRLGDRAAGAPEEVGRVGADDLDAPAHAPARSRAELLASAIHRVFCTAIVRTSASPKPASRKRSAMIARPSSTGGLKTWPRSVDHTVRSA